MSERPPPAALAPPTAMPKPDLIGERVVLRAITTADLDGGWLDWMNDAAVTRHLATPGPLTADDLAAYLAASAWPSAAMFAVCDRETGVHIGNARLSAFDWANHRCTFGWILGHPDYRGRGLGAEALALLLRYGFAQLGLHRIYSGIHADNEPSLRSARRVGMVQEGVQRDGALCEGQFVDVVDVAMLHAEFEAGHS